MAASKSWGGHRLQKEPACTRLYRTQDLDIALEGGDHYHARLGEFVADGDQCVDSAHVRKTQVHQRDVGLLSPILADGIARVDGLTDQDQVGLRLDDGGNALP